MTDDGDPGRSLDAGLSIDTPKRSFRPLQVAVIVASVGLLLTIAVTAGTFILNQRNEHHLLQLQTRQAGAVIASTVLSIRDPMSTALQIAESTEGDSAQFERFMATTTGANQLFVSASLWAARGGTLELSSSVGAPAGLSPTSGSIRSFLALALRTPTFAVMSIHVGTGERVSYAIADPSDPRFVVYAERAIPANREVKVEQNSAFSDLKYVTYLGPATSANLTTTDVPLSQVPLSGYTSRLEVPFGNTEITLVAAAKGHLAGTLGITLPWILLGAGLLITAFATVVVDQLARRRRRAEQHLQTISTLYRQVDRLYGEQRTIAEALQRALLPLSNPEIPQLEIASRYLAGTEGVDVGGDWYSVVALDDERFGFVVGDVSGRGISAATLMARIRFTIRAYLVEGHPPDRVLEMCARQLDIAVDGHFATVLVGIGNYRTGAVTIANAGHFSPILITDGHSRPACSKVGPPLGVGPGLYETEQINLESGTVLLAFTDGLIERRTESIDVGLDRLARAATQAGLSVDELLTSILHDLTQAGSVDDIAILAIKWTQVEQTQGSEPASTRALG